MTGEELLELALKAKDPEKKLEYCTKYLELNPNDSEAWEYKAEILDWLGRAREQHECFKQSLKDKPDDFLIAVSVGYGEQSLELFNKMLSEDPTFARAWYEKGNSLAVLGRYEEAIICYEKALEFSQSKILEAIAWCEKGHALLKLNRFKEAIECIDRSLEIDPVLPRALAHKGLLLEIIGMQKKEVGRNEEALRLYEEALRLYNDVINILKNPTEDETLDLRNTAVKRKQILEEELKRSEGEVKLEAESSTGMSPNVAGVLCYVLGWATGIVFVLWEKKSKFVKFHAWQSIMTFGALTVASLIMSPIPILNFYGSSSGYRREGVRCGRCPWWGTGLRGKSENKENNKVVRCM